MPRISSSSLKKSNIKKNADLLIIHLRVSDQVYTLIFGSISSIKVLFSFHACNVDLYFNGPRQVSNRSDLYTQRWWNFVCQLRCNAQYDHLYNTYLLSESVSISISRTTQEFTVTFLVDDRLRRSSWIYQKISNHKIYFIPLESVICLHLLADL